MERKLTGAQLAQREQAAQKHGAHSKAVVRREAAVVQRRLLRQAGLRVADLDGLGLAYLHSWAAAQAKVELLDRWADEHGFIDDEGNLPGWTTFYLAALNSARLSLAKLEDHLRDVAGPDPLAALEATGRRIIEARAVKPGEQS